MRKLILTALTGFAGAAAAPSLAQAVIGQPDPNSIGMQTPVTEVGERILFLYDVILVPVMVVVSLFVLALMIWIILRYNKHANKTPRKFSHNTTIEVLWTLIPVLILVAIARYSFPEVYHQVRVPTPDVTVKATSAQWSWTYSYPEHGDFEFTSNPYSLDPDVTRAAGLPAYLATTAPLVVPAGQTVEVLLTSDDVIHNFAVPSFGVRIDTIPGRLNHTWFKVDRPGTYYGQCSELCGARHSNMPIEVKVVPQAEFNSWIREQQALYGIEIGLGLDEDAPRLADAASQTEPVEITSAAPAAALR